MEFHQLEDEDDEEDAAIQYMIEQSLLESSKPRETDRDTTLRSEESGEIFSAVRQGDVKVLKDLCVGQKETFNQTDSRGWTPLHEAAAQTNQTILELTFKASGPDSLDACTARGQTPLFLAAERGLVENVTFLLDQGAQPDCQDVDHDTPLFVAIRSHCTDLVRLLLQRGSDVNQEGCHGRRPLHEAAQLGKVGFVNLLLQAGARPDPRSNYGLTSLALAAQRGHLEVVEILLKKGADIFSQAKDEASILYEACVSEHPAVISLLLEHGADANIPTHTGYMPIHRVAHRGHTQALKLLLPVTAKSDVEDSGMSPLHSAAAGGHSDCIKLLLEAGYDPNYMLERWISRGFDDERRSALFFAVSNNDMTSAKLLLEAGAMTNQDPIKCLQVALRLGNYELMNLLLRYGANVNYYCKINTTHFPSALQYALKDEVIKITKVRRSYKVFVDLEKVFIWVPREELWYYMNDREVILRMLCNYGYDVKRCFECPYGNGSHIPQDYEGWTCSVIKDTMHLSGHVIYILLDYVDHVTICAKLKAALMDQKQWPEICRVLENTRCLQHLCRLRIRQCLGRLRLRSPVFMSFLPLPQRLKDYILYREYDLLGQRSNKPG